MLSFSLTFFWQISQTDPSEPEIVRSAILKVLFIIVFVVFAYRLYAWIEQNVLKGISENLSLEGKDKRNLVILISSIIALSVSLIVLLAFHWDIVFVQDGQFRFTLVLLLTGILIILIAHLLDKIINGYLRQSLQEDKTNFKTLTPSENKQLTHSGRRTTQTIVITFFVYYLLKSAALDYTILETEIDNKNLVITITGILILIMVFLAARLFAWFMTNIVLLSYYRQKGVNIGSRFAINQLISYIIYVLALFVALDIIGVKMTLIWGALGALVIGLGLGIQGTLNDFFSGVLLLFERSVEVGDVINLKESGHSYGTVTNIGLRASKIRTIDNTYIILPNSKLVNHSVINLSHFDDKTRFRLDVGVRYGSDPEMVKSLLLSCAKAHKEVIDFPHPSVLFWDFANSSLHFQLCFYIKNYMEIERIRSELRFSINKAFIENGVEIPFPQMDVWFKNTLEQEKK